MGTMIDFHSHILPGIDDGSRSVKQSVAMLRMQARQGVDVVVATPHFYPQHDDPVDFLRRRDRAEALLREQMQAYPDLPRLFVGAEVAYFRGISESEFLPRLAVRGADCILIEMPPAPWPESAYLELAEIWNKWKIRPVIAHIDRYIGPLRTYGIPKRLAKLPVLVQANAEFFLGRFTATMAIRMLQKGQIHLLGSDCHSTTIRKPNLGPAVAHITKKCGKTAVRKIYVRARRVLNVR